MKSWWDSGFLSPRVQRAPRQEDFKDMSFAFPSKGTMVLKGASSRKRNVQILASPQRRTVSKKQVQIGDVASRKEKNGTKTEIQIGDGLYPGKLRKATGTNGGSLIPKPNFG